MSSAIRSFTLQLLSTHFESYVRYAFQQVHGQRLGNQPYVEFLCYVISQLIDSTKRLVVNLPPQHLKTFIGTICFISFMLGLDPKLRILLVAYNEAYAERLCGRIRDLMNTDWYRAIFATRIKEGHSRANDFETREGGGVFAASATRSITGITADILVYEDPHEAGDWNKPARLEAVIDNFGIVESRVQNKVKGRSLLMGHRISDNDLSAHVLQDPRWHHVALPLVAVSTTNYEYGGRLWVRRKGELLRPDAFSQEDVERLRKRMSPPFELYYQQGVSAGTSSMPRAEDFQTFAPHEEPIAPVVFSVDPGHGGGPGASRSVIQVWKFKNCRYYLLDVFCEPCDGEGLYRAFLMFARKYRPSIALIEKTADGPALHARARQRCEFECRLIVPARISKEERLGSHLEKIRQKRIYLPEHAFWSNDVVGEVLGRSNFKDHMDAMSQFFDFMDTDPIIPMPMARPVGMVRRSDFVPNKRTASRVGMVSFFFET